MTRGNGEGSHDPAGYDALLEEAHTTLEDGEPERALAILGRVVEKHPASAEAFLLSGLALLDLEEFGRAGEAFAEAARLDPGDLIAVVYEAAARFILGDGATAERALRSVIERDPEQADAHYWLSLIVERRGDYTEADRHLERAVAVDPERYGPPFRVDRVFFEERVRETLASLPEPLASAVGELPVLIEDLPPEEFLRGPEGPVPPDLLGIFVGVPFSEESVFEPSSGPTAVYLFQRNLERIATGNEHLVEEIRTTLVHEIGHYLGLSEGELHDRGLA